MGVDFIKLCAKTFEKAWDRGLRELSQPTLFSMVDPQHRQLFCAFPKEGCEFQPGRNYEIAIEQDRAVVKSGLETIGDFPNLPHFALDEIRTNGCDAAVGYVHRVHEVSGAADVTIR